jgi:prevent-host-death family protein
MSTIVTLEEAKSRLGELIEHLAFGDEIVITRNNQPLARLVPPTPSKPRPQFGSCLGMLTIISDDDEHLEHFQEYMQGVQA